MSLLIVADQNIPNVAARFSILGDVRLVDGRQLSNTQLQSADILLIRSVTKVDQQLLQGTSVRFVATATIGIDHLDCDYLTAQGIGWANAPGSNAQSVVDYIFSACCRLAGVMDCLLGGGQLGIIGMGNVGSRVYQRFAALGVNCVGYDPLLTDDTYPILTSLEQVLNSDVVCMHTPLTYDGAHPTFHLLAETELSSLKAGAVLINAGRGGSLDNQALKKVLEERDDLCVVLDVWENEPDIDIALMQRIDLATPHIAGYSFDGKLAGLEMIYQACCDFLQHQVANKVTEHESLVTLELHERGSVALIREAVLACYDVAADDQRMRGALLHKDTSTAASFDLLRKNYPERREFSRAAIGNSDQLDAKVLADLQALGFHV